MNRPKGGEIVEISASNQPIWFSVVIPLYNKAHTVVETLASVFAQEYQYFEVVIVNDGSTDGGPELIERSFHDSRFRIVHQANQGVSAARNRGVEVARHDVIAFLDADDIWLPRCLLTLAEAVRRFPDAGMFGIGCVGIHKDGSGWVATTHKSGSICHEVDFFQAPNVYSNSSTTTVRRSAFDRVGGFPVGMVNNEDFVFFHKLALAVRVVFCPAILAIINLGVEGHAGESTLMHEFAVERYRQVIDYWESFDTKDPVFIAWSIHEVRSMLFHFLRRKELGKARYLVDCLDSRLLGRLSTAEVYLVKTPQFRFPAMIWLYYTKIMWRLRGCPNLVYSQRAAVALSGGRVKGRVDIRSVVTKLSKIFR